MKNYKLSLFVLVLDALASLAGVNGGAFDWHQESYDIVLQRAETEFYNKSIIHPFKMITYKMNRKEFAFNVTGQLKTKIDKPNHGIVTVRAFKFASNEYRLKLVEFDIDLCDCVRKKFFGVLDLRYGDNQAISGCPLQKGSYKALKQTINAAEFPPNMPSGQYRVQLTISLGKVVEGIRLSVYMDLVYRPKH